MKYKEHFQHFEISVLNFYRANSHIYRLNEDDIGGQVCLLDNWNKNMEKQYPYIDLNFAFRKLENGIVCIAVFEPFFKKNVSEEDCKIWSAFHIQKPLFHEKNDAFDRWVNRYINGSWNIDDGPKIKIEKELKLINSLTKIKFESNLFKYDEYRLVNYPIAQNNEEYTKAILELYRLVIDGMSKECIINISNHLKIELTDKNKRLNSLKELLSSQELIENIYKPFKDISNKRMPIHGISSKGIISYPAFDTFNQDLKNIYNALSRLRIWLENKFNIDAKSCLKRLESFSNFPQISKPPQPGFKLMDAFHMVGKTIKEIEFGEISSSDTVHQSEAINIFFTDSTAISIQIGSNAHNIAMDNENIKPSDIHTDIMLFWAEKIITKKLP